VCPSLKRTTLALLKFKRLAALLLIRKQRHLFDQRVIKNLRSTLHGRVIPMVFLENLAKLLLVIKVVDQHVVRV
jgi:hypothetical protein